MPRRPPVASHVDRLERALEKVARLVVQDPVYAPIFLRLEEEIVKARLTTDAITRARMIAQRSRSDIDSSVVQA